MSQRQINVCVRLRPRPPAQNAVWRQEANTLAELGVPDREPRKFTYDRVFGEDAGNADIYETFAAAVVEDAMRGYHGAVVARGPA